MRDSTNLSNISLAIIYFWQKLRHSYVICVVIACQNILDCKSNKIKLSVGPVSVFTTTKIPLTTWWSWSITLEAVCRSCLSPIFSLLFGNRCTHSGKGLCQISHFIPKTNDFTLVLALASLLTVIAE